MELFLAALLLNWMCACVCACVLSRFSHVQLSVTLWTIAHQASLSLGILQARILEWVGCPALLQGIFWTQGSNLHLLPPALAVWHWIPSHYTALSSWLIPWRICNIGDPGLTSGSGRFPWRREWLPTPVFLPGEFQGQRSLAGYSPWDDKVSDTTEQLTLYFHFLPEIFGPTILPHCLSFRMKYYDSPSFSMKLLPYLHCTCSCHVAL